MKKQIFFALLVIATLCCVISCSPPKVDNQSSSLTNELSDARSKIQGLTQDVAKLQSENKSLQANNDRLQKDYDKLQRDYKNLQDEYNKFLEMAKKSSFSNISWTQLQDVLKRDSTDKLEYIEGKFDSQGFALSLRDRLSRYGIRCAYVSVGFDGRPEQALNAFETTDKGMVFVDCVGSDKIAYVEKGRPYGTIRLEAVKTDYIATEGKPGEFWRQLVWKTHSNPFSYDFYTLYLQRWSFYNESTDAHDKAVDEFHAGYPGWSSERLYNWEQNLKALKEDLGSVQLKPMGTVKNIEIYWN